MVMFMSCLMMYVTSNAADREYFSDNEYKYSNAKAKVYEISLKGNVKKDIELLVKSNVVKTGDVIQYDTLSNHHSIFVSEKNSTTVKFSSHSKEICNEDISRFINSLSSKNVNKLYIIHMSN